MEPCNEESEESVDSTKEVSCDLVASIEVLSNHFNREHCDSLIEFSYGHPFIVFLKSSDVTVVLQEENDGRLYTLNNSTIT
ncbi:hypothetical protein RYX36_006414, partial [Vicia faba]